MTEPKMPRRDWAFVLVMAAIYLGLASYWMDISYFDESFYMDSGTHVHLGDFLHQIEFAPLYAFWYKMLAVVCPWPVWRFFLSWGILAAVAILLPVAMRLRGAWLYAWLLVCVPFLGMSTLAVVPYVTLFAACLLLAGATVVRRFNLGLHEAAFVALAACFLVALARPEFAYFVPVLAVAWFVVSRSSRPNQGEKSSRKPLYVVVALTLLMLVILRHGSGSRSGIAFAQHFNLRASANHLLRPGEDPWSSNYALTRFHVDPGGTAASTTATIKQFAGANPSLFAGHILANLTSPITWLSCLVILAGLSIAYLPSKRPEKPLAQLRPMGLYLLLISLAPILSILLIYPAEHYFVMPLPVVLLYFAELSIAAGWVGSKLQPWLLAAAFPLIVLSTPGRAPLRQHESVASHPVLHTVLCLQQLQRIPTTNNDLLFDAVGLAPVLLGAPHQRVEMWDISGWANFQAWVERQHPAWIEVTPMVTSFYGVSSSEMATYLESRFYTPHPCPTTTIFKDLQVYVAAR